MKRIYILILCLCCVSCQSQNKILNWSLPEFKADLVRYYENGTYSRDFEHSLNQAADQIDEQLRDKVNNPAVIIAVEDVLLSTYDIRKENSFNDFKGERDIVEQNIILAKLKSNDYTIKLYNYLLAHRVSVFLISKRDESLRIPLLENLTINGVGKWSGVFMTGSSSSNFNDYYNQVYEGLENSGYEVIGMILPNRYGTHFKKKRPVFLVPNRLY